MKKFLFLVPVLALTVPMVAFGQYFQNLVDMIGSVGGMVQLLNGIIIAIGILLFFYGLLKYLTKKEAKERADAKSQLIWGLIIIFVMTTLFGVIQFFRDTLQIDGGEETITPGFNLGN
jgi:uncharacterized membrane protein YidH (DUF202 family)